MGIHSEIITVSQVSVKVGGSISIPCLYDPEYTYDVKYLCKGLHWILCCIKVDTNTPNSNSGRFSISDDKNQGIFTVTINNITDEDTHYWCAVKRNMISHVVKYFQLSVTTGMSNLYVDHQEMTSFEGGSVTVVCHYNNLKKAPEWCRLGSTCVTDQSGSIDETAVTINSSVFNVFAVTMSELRTKSSGWYLCAKGDLQMPVHITVNELPSTTMDPRAHSTTHQHSSLPSSVEPCTAQPTNSTITGADGGSLQDEHKRSTQSSQTGSVPDVLYTTVVHNQHVAQKQEQTPKESVTYSTIVIRDDANQMTEPEEHSTVGPH
ncbi:polymeric immunoglobulin receptor-like [Scomber scombrus]|uniref:polymeric immunoglobulin receptor-like n=1 Tax=Scomber scombrus TaxID=13677 RepID=UPI002DD7F22A|nr:polymeric immunoglobulin receptor-like [Scomber scombrus]